MMEPENAGPKERIIFQSSMIMFNLLIFQGVFFFEKAFSSNIMKTTLPMAENAIAMIRNIFFFDTPHSTKTKTPIEHLKPPLVANLYFALADPCGFYC